MKLIVGLGNFDSKYFGTRHNIGFVVLDKLVKQSWKMSKNTSFASSWYSASVLLVKPQTNMNASGKAVAQLVKKHDINLDDLYVVHDDLDIELGKFKIQHGKGPKVHGGLLSIYNLLDTKNFWHIRLGIENRQKETRISGEAYVLNSFTKDEQMVVSRVTDEVVDNILNNVIKSAIK